MLFPWLIHVPLYSCGRNISESSTSFVGGIILCLCSEYREEFFVILQMVFISMGASRQHKKRDSLDSPSVLPPPPRESLPTLLLLQPQYFEQLFCLMQTLSSMKTPVKGGVSFLSGTLSTSLFERK